MPDTTTIQSLPLIQPSQAQKHVTHNEALKLIDVMIQLAVVNRMLTAAPASPIPGQCHIVAAAATGVWAGQATKVAVFTGSVWEFFVPRTGWQAWIAAEGQMAIYTGAAWVATAEAPAVFSQLGVSATPDATNRLSVSSPATLLNNAGAGHQVKVNKATAGDTASLLFQTGFSGRAEMGTAGGDDFSIKVSADGTTFRDGVVLDRSTGRVKVMNGLKVTPAAGDLAGPVDGEVWYNSTTAKFRAQQNGVSVDVVGGSTSVFSDAVFALQDNGDATKQAQFELSAVTTGTVRALTVPDASGTLVLAGAAQTLTNKTIALASNTITGLGALATASSVNLSSQATGTLQAAQEPAHSGDVINTAGSLALTVAAGAVSNAKLAQVATATIKGRTTAGTGSPEDLTPAQAKAVLAIAAGDVAGLGALATLSSVNLSSQATGTLQAAQEPAHSGDVTNSAGSLALTIAAGAVSNAKLAQVATATIKGRTTAGTGDTEDLTAAQTTALLIAFTTTVKGLVPAPVTATGKVLKDDGTWAAPPAAGATTQMQFNNAGVLAGATDVLVESNRLRLPTASSTTAPAAGGVLIVGRLDTAGRTVPAFISQDGVVRDLQTALTRSSPMIWKAQNGTTIMSVLAGLAPGAVGTATLFTIATTNLVTYTPRLEYLITVAATTAIAGFRGLVGNVTLGGPSAGLGGFNFVGRWGPSTGVATTTGRAFFGMAATLGVPTDVEPSTLVSCVFMGWDAADTNIQMMHNDAVGTCTKIDLGASFPVPTTDRTALYELALYSPKGTTQSVGYQVTDLVSGATVSGTITTDMPAATALLAPRGWMSVGGTSSVIGLGLNSLVLDPML